MKAGIELDTLIAEKIFGHKVVHKTWNKDKYHSYTLGEPDYYDSAGEMILNNTVPSYSEDITVAWEVVEKLRTTNPEVFHLSRALRLELHDNGPKYGWSAGFRLENDGPGDDQTYWHAQAETAPLAICLAALDTTKE